jgi:hypothetical protein
VLGCMSERQSDVMRVTHEGAVPLIQSHLPINSDELYSELYDSDDEHN